MGELLELLIRLLLSAGQKRQAAPPPRPGTAPPPRPGTAAPRQQGMNDPNYRGPTARQPLIQRQGRQPQARRQAPPRIAPVPPHRPMAMPPKQLPGARPSGLQRAAGALRRMVAPPRPPAAPPAPRKLPANLTPAAAAPAARPAASAPSPQVTALGIRRIIQARPGALRNMWIMGEVLQPPHALRQERVIW